MAIAAPKIRGDTLVFPSKKTPAQPKTAPWPLRRCPNRAIEGVDPPQLLGLSGRPGNSPSPTWGKPFARFYQTRMQAAEIAIAPWRTGAPYFAAGGPGRRVRPFSLCFFL